MENHVLTKSSAEHTHKSISSHAMIQLETAMGYQCAASTLGI